MDDTIYEASGLVGDAVNPIQQQYSDTCAIKSQQLILNEFGFDVNEDQLVQIAYENGWYEGDGSGTSFENVGRLLEYAGIDVTRQADANVFNLVSELSQGHKVIVGVDSGELWGGKITGWLKDFFLGDTPDHAIVVAGIDTSDPKNIMVIVDDPGTGDYHKAYPLDDFMDAWSDAQCYMVSTNAPVPAYASTMVNFDYSQGHLTDIGGMDYSDFQIFNDISLGLPSLCTVDGEHSSPVSSLMDAYHDVARGTVEFSSIFDDGSYNFSDHLNTDDATQAMLHTFQDNLGHIDFNAIGASIDANNASATDYASFLNDSINDFNAIGDSDSALLCQQQLMMVDYCDCNGLDFCSIFF